MPETVAGETERVEKNLGLVYGLVRKLIRTPEYQFVAEDDLVSAGMEALLSAARRFDPDRGTKFSTFASVCIMRALKNANIRHRMLSQEEEEWAGSMEHIIDWHNYDELPEEITGICRLVVEWHLGLADGEKRNLDEIACFLGCGREQVKEYLEEARECLSV